MKRMVITGGPCAGKTSALEELRKRFARRGIAAIFVPEAATDLIMAGIAPWTCDSVLGFQTQVIALQMKREAQALDEAAKLEAGLRESTDVFVVYDRGVCDSHAYLSDEEFDCALASNGLTEATALERYDAVFHLETVAKTDSAAYTRANNEARFENALEAVEVDGRVADAWSKHRRMCVVSATGDFSQKVDELERLILAG